MSAETVVWLNTMTLQGFTDKRGNAWHYQPEAQGDEPNHYPGAIPVADVRRRLFYWQAAEGDVTSTVLTEDGVTTYTDESRKAIIRPARTFGQDDPGAILGVFKSGYRGHAYARWLVDNVEKILDDGLSIGSAGLLRGGAVAWVQVELPDNVQTPEGVEFRPFLSAATSYDGSLASTYLTGARVVVCDNTLSAALGAKDAKSVRVRHSRNSLGRITEVRDALGIVYQVADSFAAEVKELCATTVTDQQWSAFLDAHAALTDEKTGKAKEGRGLTMATNKRDALDRLWSHDTRVSPWHGTAWGVVQAVNTFAHHDGPVGGTNSAERTANRAERNMLRVVTGGVDALDQGTLDTLQKVLVASR
jgi:phage/plasmid-like protein (TIGR03299 family)